MNLDLKTLKANKSMKELLEFSIINLDKPSGPPSFSITKYVRDSLGLRKASHLGTLDPAVTGVLPIALNRACRLMEYLMHRNKVYVGIMRVHGEVSLVDLKKAMKKFTGKIIQLPPLRSRVKRAERVREVKKFKIIERDGKNVLFFADVQAGTYIRTLCDSVGKELGTGAHMLELRREKAAIFDESEIYNLYDFDKAVEEYKNGNEELLREMLIPGEIVSTVIPIVMLKPDVYKSVMVGSPIFEKYIEEKPKEIKKDDKICAFIKDKFVGCYRAALAKDLYAVPEFVFN